MKRQELRFRGSQLIRDRLYPGARFRQRARRVILAVISMARFTALLGIHPILLPLLGLAGAFLGVMVSPWWLVAAIVFFALWGIGFIRWMLTGR